MAIAALFERVRNLTVPLLAAGTLFPAEGHSTTLR